MSSYKKLASIDTARRRLLFHIGAAPAAGVAGTSSSPLPGFTLAQTREPAICKSLPQNGRSAG